MCGDPAYGHHKVFHLRVQMEGEGRALLNPSTQEPGVFVKTTKPGSYLHLRPEGDFNVFTYTFHATKKSWNDAQLICEADGGNLASIHSP